jgi:hypothetical protein
MWEKNTYRILVRKRPLGTPRTILKWILGWSGVDWIDVAQNRDNLRALVSTLMNLRVP